MQNSCIVLRIILDALKKTIYWIFLSDKSIKKIRFKQFYILFSKKRTMTFAQNSQFWKLNFQNFQFID